MPERLQHAVEDAVDNILRVPEEVRRPRRHVFRTAAALKEFQETKD